MSECHRAEYSHRYVDLFPEKVRSSLDHFSFLRCSIDKLIRSCRDFAVVLAVLSTERRADGDRDIAPSAA